MDKKLTHKNAIIKPLDKPIDKPEKENDSAIQRLHRRMKDNITSSCPTRNMNLERRNPKSERRVNSNPSYNGPSRRFTIDRRLSAKDRRVVAE